jgi:two-component system response regulator RegX3
MVRIEAVLRRVGKISGDQVLDIGAAVFDGRNLVARCAGNTVELTRREMDIVAHLHRHRDRIVSKKELLTDVWHYADADIETRTVDIHILKLRKKMNALTRKVIITTIRGEGYRLEVME